MADRLADKTASSGLWPDSVARSPPRTSSALIETEAGPAEEPVDDQSAEK
jgi:hypothetical protein